MSDKKNKDKIDEWNNSSMDKEQIENWKRCLNLMKESEALTVTNGKTPIRKIKNQIIEQINFYENEFILLSEERKEKNKETKQMLVDVLKDICISIDDFYIEHEKEFIKNTFKDGLNPINENLKPYLYYQKLIN
jgi:hypothetical protein